MRPIPTRDVRAGPGYALLRQAILSHFRLLRPGGTAIITFPTPTLLYRVARRSIEALGKWKFHDERPLMPEEVLAAISERAGVLARKTMWPLILTQHVVVARKRDVDWLPADAAVRREARDDLDATGAFQAQKPSLGISHLEFIRNPRLASQSREDVIVGDKDVNPGTFVRLNSPAPEEYRSVVPWLHCRIVKTEPSG